ncbi:hypothetical protein ACJX0J_025851, partial [Zea mays]
ANFVDWLGFWAQEHQYGWNQNMLDQTGNIAAATCLVCARALPRKNITIIYHPQRRARAHVANPVTTCIPSPCDYMYPQSIFNIVHHYMRLENYSFLFKKDHVYDETIT